MRKKEEKKQDQEAQTPEKEKEDATPEEEVSMAEKATPWKDEVRRWLRRKRKRAAGSR